MQIVKAKIDSMVRFHLEGCSDLFLATVRQHFTRSNPIWEKAKQRGANTDGIERYVRLYVIDDVYLSVPRGSINALRSIARRCDVKIGWSPVSTVYSRELIPFEDMQVSLREYQKQAVSRMVSKVQGSIKAPCGAGKTIIGAAAIVRVDQPAVVFVHTMDLLDQWVSLFRSWNYRVRAIYGGRTNGLERPLLCTKGSPEIAVAMVKTIHNNLEKAAPMLSSAGAIVVDEAHHSPAVTFRQVINACPARFRWGVTATPQRPDGLGFMMPMIFGEQLWSITMKELVALGHLMMPKLIRVETDANLRSSRFEFNGRVSNAKAVNELCRNKHRTVLLTNLTAMLAGGGLTVLVLVPRVAYAHSLAQALMAMGVSATAVTSKIDKVFRKQRISQVRSGSMKVLVATQLADEGLDIPTLDVVIMASGGKAAGRTIQRMGRVVRTNAGKTKCWIVDFVDPWPFMRQADSRLSAYFSELGVIDYENLRGEGIVDSVREKVFGEQAPIRARS